MQIVLAEKAGFCTGVKRAVQMAADKMQKGEKWYTWGPLVHNKAVVCHLESGGIKTIQRLEEVEGGGLIIRAHGISPKNLNQAQKLGMIIEDATCSLVKKVHDTGRMLIQEGYEVIVFGDKEHPETQGIVGWCEDQAVVVKNMAEAEQLLLNRKLKKIGLISQTTKNEQEYFSIAQLFLAHSSEMRFFNTICPATRLRQESARNLCVEVDMMVVIGDKESSNTRALYQECEHTGVKTLLIQSAADLHPEMFVGVYKVGVTAGASTPDWIIKEVVDRMEQFEEGMKAEEMQTEESFAKMEAAMADVELPGRGDIVKGTIVQVLDDEVMVDVGGKSEGIIPLRELSNQEVKSAKDLVKVGDEIEVLVLKWDDDGSTILLSKKKVDNKLAMEKLEQVYENGEVIQGTITSTVKGGMLVDIGVTAFLPASHVELGFTKNLEDYVGKTFDFKIIEFNKNKKRGSQIVVSRKELLEAEKSRMKEEFWDKIAVGQVLEGTVKRLADYGAFIDLGGFEGLLHVSEIDYVRVDKPSSVFKEGDKVEVYVLALDPDKQRVSLSRKKLLKSPWKIVSEKYKEGDIVEGTVVRMASFGAFVEIEPGVDGLVHISQIVNHRIEKPSDVLEIGQKVQAKILSIDMDQKRIGLSIKAAANNEESAQDPEVAEYMAKQDDAE